MKLNVKYMTKFVKVNLYPAPHRVGYKLINKHSILN